MLGVENGSGVIDQPCVPFIMEEDALPVSFLTEKRESD